ncbi:DUF4287 domain-containing protein [Glycomyces algeriensis]|uniref:DUF4287 domain-containing protein n=1 Tax=Glycomyces algeriensis TaxID=256037 RepID=A0A9W6G7K0_9ACTN|nr:DUF4287 domain-containing protein [Glycomyces algeriensis]MDA1366072.1 DUF4287 domain-containing protein [Glycomyces algeriensis]MDR7349161.1 hypothetical protein [Glycomyces algeriensis]GLI41861.1 hypothetical protein GALLR39Z86_17110 [Glycomyces algeriensis]
MTAPKPNGPHSYFPSIEQKYGRPIADWLADIAASDLDGHKALVDWLKTEHGMGHGHANALVTYQRNPGKWPVYTPE